MKSLEEIHPYISIHALLAESDAHQNRINKSLPYFYPRSPCGERPAFVAINPFALLFLSTLSLRRATGVSLKIRPELLISIHALLAESDLQRLTVKTQAAEISIHALLAESDQQSRGSYIRTEKFLSTLSLRRATVQHRLRLVLQKISIHALLAESDQKQTALLML